MKISQFANQYNLKVRTVRYYIDRALLNPKKKNNQYIFDETCAEEMERILLYKKYRFTLQEIELLFFLEKTSNLRDREVNAIITDILNQKKLEVSNEIQELKQVVGEINGEIEKYESIVADDEKNETEFNIPLNFISNLVCPACASELSLNNAHLCTNSIYSGMLTCGCGYKALLSGGIIFSEGYVDDTPFKVFNNVKSVLSIADEYSDSYRMLVDKGYSWIYHNLPQMQSGSIVLLGPFTANFLLKYRNKLKTDVTYVIVDPSVRRLQSMQYYLRGFRAKTVFIAGDINSIPLKKGIVDCYVDDFSTINNVFTYNDYLIENISTWLKSGGVLTGILNEYAKSPNTLVNVKKTQPSFDHKLMTTGKIKAAIKSSGIDITNEKFIGETSGNEKHMPYNVDGEQLGLIGYTARKL